jgi:hypothetical protein
MFDVLAAGLGMFILRTAAGERRNFHLEISCRRIIFWFDDFLGDRTAHGVR